MRDYLSPAKRAMARVVPHPAVVRAFIMKRRAFVFIMVASFVVITTLGFVSVRALVATDSKTERVTEAKGQSSSLSNSTIDNQPVVSQDATVTGDNSMTNATTPNSENKTNTTVTVNDQKIDVPQNGTVHRTVTNGDGTTNVTVTTNTSSDGSTSTNSYTSTNTNSFSTSSGTSSSVNITTQ